MKTTIIAACLLLSGCSAFPKVEADHWVHEGSYGPVTTHYEAKNIRRAADGSLHVESYSGSVKVLGGYGVSDTVSDLVIPASSGATVAQPVK